MLLHLGLDLRLDLGRHVGGQGGKELHGLLQSRDGDELVPYGGLYLDLPWDAGWALGLELHLQFSLDGGRLGEELRRGLRRRWCLARLRRGRGWLRLLLDVDLQGPVELGLEGRLRGRGQDLWLERRLDPSRTLDLREGLVWKLHLRMNLRLHLRGRLQRRPLLELDAHLRVDLALCLGLEGLDLLNLAKVLQLDLSADLRRDRGGRGLDLARARHDRRHRKTLQDLGTGRLNHWNL